MNLLIKALPTRTEAVAIAVIYYEDPSIGRTKVGKGPMSVKHNSSQVFTALERSGSADLR